MCIIDVYQMAEARENRRNNQLKLMKKFNFPLISFTLNIPGPRKSSFHFSRIHAEGIRIIYEKLNGSVINMDSYKLLTGNEAYFSIDLAATVIKRITIEIEDTHKMGRIFDIDVLDKEGLSISRTTLGMKPRKCLICPEEAAVCSRSRSHTVEDLLEEIESITRKF